MCGIIGIIANKYDVVSHLFNGLVSQNYIADTDFGAGTIGDDGGKHLIPRKGLVIYGVKDLKLKSYPGRSGVGHIGCNNGLANQPVLLRNGILLSIDGNWKLQQ